MIRRVLVALGNRMARSMGGTAAYSAGKHYMDRGKYELAATAFVDAEHAFSKRYGSSHEWVVDSQFRRAWCYVQAGRYEDGISLYRSMLKNEESQPNPRGPLILQALGELATAYDAAGLRDEADRVRQQLESW